jgi:hypothetical protein
MALVFNHFRSSPYVTLRYVTLHLARIRNATEGGVVPFSARGQAKLNLAPASAVQPNVYLRAAAPLAAPVRQGEGVLGLMVRPVRRLPFSVMGQVRMQDNGGEVRVQPVITAVRELPPMRLPMASEAELCA